MRRYGWVCLLFFLTGCIMLPERTAPPPVESAPKSVVRELTSISRVSLRMTKEEVKGLMGPSVTIGFEKSFPSADFTPITIPNPQRTEVVKARWKTWEVEYYFTQVNQPDGIISDDELTPLVFKNGRLAGQGWAFLKTIKPR